MTQASQLVESVGAWLAYQLGMRDCFYVAALGAFGATTVAMSMVEAQRRQKDQSAGMSIRNVITRALTVVRTNPRFGYLAVFSSLLTAVGFLLTFVIYQPYTVALGYSIVALGSVLVSTKTGIDGGERHNLMGTRTCGTADSDCDASRAFCYGFGDYGGCV
ncbi:hypothetical protein BFX06_05560 [Sulfobacillus thermosulfidooxidans]|nr:hypothetical protein BFX05_14845 [Sulfobacillus thermosulfidooxidans]OLZ14770.1 hypothetical protein BFX06_05560 [Sulfobacillus thermosulfidooxidans]OLZ22086.1 hypothetical protein BFX07_10810 [Sulfobacillus thermosulfidooxidans]